MLGPSNYQSFLTVGNRRRGPAEMMRHADIRTTMNIYGGVVTDEMTTAGVKVSQLAFQGKRQERNGS